MCKNTLNPNWPPFEVKSQTLCNGDIDRTVKVICYDWNSSGKYVSNNEFVSGFQIVRNVLFLFHTSAF